MSQQPWRQGFAFTFRVFTSVWPGLEKGPKIILSFGRAKKDVIEAKIKYELNSTVKLHYDRELWHISRPLWTPDFYEVQSISGIKISNLKAQHIPVLWKQSRTKYWSNFGQNTKLALKKTPTVLGSRWRHVVPALDWTSGHVVQVRLVDVVTSSYKKWEDQFPCRQNGCVAYALKDNAKGLHIAVQPFARHQ